MANLTKHPVHLILLALCWLMLLLGAASADSDFSVQSLPTDQQPVDVRHPDPEKIEQFADDRDFYYDRDPEVPVSFWSKLWYWIWQRNVEMVPGSFNYYLYRSLPYILILLALYLVLSRLSQTQFSGLFYKRETGSVRFDSETEDIHEIDFDRQIEAAVTSGQLRLAVRLLYLKTLKRLSNRGLIDWKPDKTNRQYEYELAGNELRGPFRELTRVFEYSWYGEFPLDDPTFQQTARSFHQFERKVGSPR